MTDALDRWLADDEKPYRDDAGEDYAEDVFAQIDALAAERLERNDGRWLPSDTSERGMAKLVQPGRLPGSLLRLRGGNDDD